MPDPNERIQQMMRRFEQQAAEAAQVDEAFKTHGAEPVMPDAPPSSPSRARLPGLPRDQFAGRAGPGTRRRPRADAQHRRVGREEVAQWVEKMGEHETDRAEATEASDQDQQAARERGFNIRDGDPP